MDINVIVWKMYFELKKAFSETIFLSQLEYF